jgi:cephalosporin-C deacetylase
MAAVPLTDLTLQQCLDYRPELPEPADLDAFWSTTLADAAKAAAPAILEAVDTGLRQVETFDVTFSGFAGEPVRGWLHLPTGATAPLAGVVEYLGYSAGRGLPHERNLWAVAGYAHLVMDSRGQAWSGLGATADVTASYGAAPGVMTRGIESPDTYYYRRLFTDAVRAAETLRDHPAVDASRVFVAGGSQGGGLSLATAGLVPWLKGVMADVPFLCHFRRAADVASSGPYGEISAYLHTYRDQVETVFETLSYFDAAVLVRRAVAPALVSIAMMDQVCPPSTCFAAFHNYAGPKDVRVYEFNNHEGGGPFQQVEQLGWAARTAESGVAPGS